MEPEVLLNARRTRPEVTASGAGRLYDEQNFVRSAAVGCIKVPSGAGKMEISGRMAGLVSRTPHGALLMHMRADLGSFCLGEERDVDEIGRMQNSQRIKYRLDDGGSHRTAGRPRRLRCALLRWPPGSTHAHTPPFGRRGFLSRLLGPEASRPRERSARAVRWSLWCRRARRVSLCRPSLRRRDISRQKWTVSPTQDGVQLDWGAL